MWAPDSRRGNRHQRGYGNAWEETRLYVLRRDKYLCQACLKAGTITALVVGEPSHPRSGHVDHIIPKSQGGTDDPSNLQALCRLCHEAKTARETKKNVIGCDEDGWPVVGVDQKSGAVA